MTGEIIEIHSIKKSRNEGENFIRIEFRLDGGSWAKTDLVPHFRNFRRWAKLLKIGNILGNLELKDAMTIDADSFPILIEGEKIEIRKGEKFGLEELNKLGVFG